MVHFSDLVQIQTRSGSVVTAGGIAITPISQQLVVRLPGARIEWHRPAAILVARAGQVQRIPIVNVTRLIRFGLWSVCFSLLVVQWIVTVRNERRQIHD